MLHTTDTLGASMAKVSHLIRRGGAYSARRRVPLDLVAIVGKREFVKALGTSDPNEARRRLLPVLMEWQAQINDLYARRALVASDYDDATWDQYTGALARDEEERARRPDHREIESAEAELIERVKRGDIASADPLVILDATLDVLVKKNAKEISGDFRSAKLSEIRKHIASNEAALIAADVDEYIRKKGLIVDRVSPEWISLARRMMRAEAEALERTFERDRGEYGGIPKDPLVKPPSGSRREHAKPGETILELFEVFSKDNPRGVTKDRLDQCRRDINTFVELVGVTFPISNITKVEVRNWKQLLIKYPVKATETNAFAGMAIEKIIKENEKINKPVISDRTVNRYLSSLSAFLYWAENNGYIERNPVPGLMIKKEIQAKTNPFSVEQLNIIFNSPLFVGCLDSCNWNNISKPGKMLIRDYRYWVPLIMLFSGARPGEIGQLAVSDVRQEHGHWIMHITIEGEKVKEGKSVKTEGSMRVIPIHPELIKLGFLEYHEMRVKGGGAALFPGATRNARGQMMADLSREFGRYLTRIGIKEGRGLSLYSFRHGVADALRSAGYLDAEFGFILGHTKASMTGRYGRLPEGMLQKRVELINSISYPNIILSHLYQGKNLK